MVSISEVDKHNRRLSGFIEKKLFRKYGFVSRQPTDPRKGVAFVLRDEYVLTYYSLEPGPQVWAWVKTDAFSDPKKLEQILRGRISEIKLDRTSRYITGRRFFYNGAYVGVKARVKKTKDLDREEEELLDEEVWTYLINPVIDAVAQRLREKELSNNE
jgi:hypothetical protein